MKILLHYENKVAPKPGGIWWLGPNENVESYYTDQELRKLGEDRFLSLNPDADYEEYFEYLDGKMPYEDTWALEEISDDTTPQEYLSTLQKD